MTTLRSRAVAEAREELIELAHDVGDASTADEVPTLGLRGHWRR